MRMADLAMLREQPSELIAIIKYNDGENSGAIYLVDEDFENKNVRFSQSKDIELIRKINEDILNKIGGKWEKECFSSNQLGAIVLEVEKYSPKIVESGNNYTYCIKNFDDVINTWGEYFVTEKFDIDRESNHIFINLDSTEPKIRDVSNLFENLDGEVYKMYTTRTLRYPIYMTEEQAGKNKIFKEVTGDIVKNTRRTTPYWPELNRDYYLYNDDRKKELLASLGYSLNFDIKHLDIKFRNAYELVLNSREIYGNIIYSGRPEE